VDDLNADGYQDIFITAGMACYFRYGINSLLLNDAGKSFVQSEFILGVEPRRDNQTVMPWFDVDCDGEDFTRSECKGHVGKLTVLSSLASRSSVIFDLDNDGDLDIVTNDFLSEGQAGGNKIQSRGTGSSRRCIRWKPEDDQGHGWQVRLSVAERPSALFWPRGRKTGGFY
jgi:hypothetical protein